MRPRKDFFFSQPRPLAQRFPSALRAIGSFRLRRHQVPHGAAAIACAFIVALTLAGCDPSPTNDFGGLAPSTTPVPQVEPVAPLPAETLPRGMPSYARPIRIASFNIQVFGQAKMAKANVVSILADVVRQFDIVAVQEIRSANQNVMPRFMDHVNQFGSKYDFVIGPRLGRSHSKEQYAYVYNTDTIRLFWPSVYTLQDEQDLFHRQPLVASFQSIVNGPGKPFRFTLMNVHVDPDEARYELTKLDDAFQATQADIGGEDDVILAGDFNADPRDYQELGRLANVAWAVVGIPTNTRGTRGYDNLLFDRLATVEYLGRAGVMDLQSRYQLTLEQALDVSDHLPVWAEFYPYEVEQNLDLATPHLEHHR